MVQTTRIVLGGRVQGVGFRVWIERRARDLGLSGWVRNLRDGTVEAVFHGPDAAVHEMIAQCRRGPSAARVEMMERHEDAEEPPYGFLVRSSE